MYPLILHCLNCICNYLKKILQYYKRGEQKPIFFHISHIMGEDHNQTELYSVVSYCIAQNVKIKLFYY